MRTFLLLVGVALIVASNPQASLAQGDVPYRFSKVEGEAPSADSLFHGIERHLLAAQTMKLAFRVEAKGAITVGLDGTLDMRHDQAVRLRSEGTFMSNPADLALTSNGTQMQGGSAAGTFDKATPEALNESLVVGFMRMGILHNLARLTAGVTPDHADGGVAEWVQVRAFTDPESVILEGKVAQTITFQIYVSGQHAGEASLWVDAETGFPLQRTQVVHFEHGTMNVVERYHTVLVNEPLGEDTFALSK